MKARFSSAAVAELKRKKKKEQKETKKIITKSVSLCVCRPGYSRAPELCEAGWVRVAAALGGPGVAAVGAAGGDPV